MTKYGSPSSVAPASRSLAMLGWSRWIPKGVWTANGWSGLAAVPPESAIIDSLVADAARQESFEFECLRSEDGPIAGNIGAKDDVNLVVIDGWPVRVPRHHTWLSQQDGIDDAGMLVTWNQEDSETRNEEGN